MYMKASLAVAVLAVVAGWVCSGAVSKGLAATGFYGVALAAAAVAVFRIWRLTIKVLQNLEICAEKLTYMEHRMDKAEAHISDVCRHLTQMFVDFDPLKNPGVGASKWWWCSRRVRDLYAAFGASMMEKGALMQHIDIVWKLMQLEVYLRACRDLVQERINKLHYPEQYYEEAELSYLQAVKNMLEGKGKIDLWQPMELADVQILDVGSPWELVLKLQIMERYAELESYKASCSEGIELFAGTGFQISASSSI